MRRGDKRPVLARDYSPAFTLIDIEETPSNTMAGQKAVPAMPALPQRGHCWPRNGVKSIDTINPRRTPEQVRGVSADLATSLYSCRVPLPG